MPNEKVKQRNIDCALENAYRLFLANGVEGTTIEMLARATGISRSSLDRYFHHKLDLVLQTAKWISENLLDKNAQLCAFSQQSELSGLEMLRQYMQMLLELLYQNPRLFVLAAECRAFVFRNSAEYPAAPQTLKAYLGSSVLLERIFERGMADGSIRPLLDARTEAVMTRESILGFFSSIILANDAALLNEQLMADLFVARIIQQYQGK